MSARARHRRTGSRGSVGKKILLALGVVLGVLGIAAAVGAGYVYSIMDDAPSIDTLKPLDSGENSVVYDATGERLGFIDAEIVRERVDLNEIPKSLQNATIAIEDENFYEHDGVDIDAIIRAAVENVEAGEIEQGASTITQQLVRNLYIKEPEDTLERKLHEAKMAMDYEDRYSKRQILEQYLNTATYGTNAGDTAVGVEAASQVYFNKHVSDLSVKESALLAGLPQAPSQYNPFINPERATQRRNLVLNAMQEQGYIDAADYQQLVSDDLGLERGARYDEIREQYFFDYVQQELIEEYGTDTVRLGGLEVHTTIDPQLQTLARESIAAHPVTSAAAALVSTDTQTGEILAMASSTNYETDQFNLAAQGERQPGSAFKPFALTAAVEQGIDPDSTHYAAPSTITLTPCDGCPPWTVSGGGGGAMTLRSATAESINTVFAQLVLDIGADAMVETAKKMGITAELGGYPAEVLGGLTRGVSVLQMSNAYATLANGGVHHEPTAIRRVEFPDGEVDEPSKEPGKRVLQDGVALEVVDVMTGTFDYGTLTCCDIPCPAAGKTGTTELQSDAWTVGFTPQVSTAVWVGNPDARIPLPGYSFDLAGPIWHDYMAAAATEPCDDFPEPKDPASLSPGFGSYTVDPNAPTTTGTDETDPDQQTDADGDGVPDDGYDDDLYAPGAGQEPLPTPGNGNGNANGLGNGNGGGPRGGAGGVTP
jgi:penicillin-binding protein 1A